MSWAHRFMVVPAAHLATARELVNTIAPRPSVEQMWTVGLNATGSGGPTHWVSTGLIQANFAAILGNAEMTYGAYLNAGGSALSLADVEGLYAAATIRSNAQGVEIDVLDSIGLKLIRGTL